MSRTVVRTVEELKAAHEKRAHPTIVVEGELASNLIAVGAFLGSTDGNGLRWDPQYHTSNGKPTLLQPLFDVLHDLSRNHKFELLSSNSERKIKIYPYQRPRREGN
jgi:hypothetical protein